MNTLVSTRSDVMLTTMQVIVNNRGAGHLAGAVNLQPALLYTLLIVTALC